MLQIRITNADGSDPIILNQAENKSYFKSINLGEEGVSFEVGKNSPKADVLNPDGTGYKKFWEVWNTRTNQRLNRGPIDSIAEDGPNWKVSGSGRSALLNNFYKSIKTFYYPIDTVLDDIRYENIAIQPRTTTLVSTDPGTETPIFGSVVSYDEKYQGLSKQTKDNAIDDNTGYFKPGQIEPSNTYYTTNSYWSGQSDMDTHIVDLGGIYDLSKITLTLPWWGGAQKGNNRTYDFAIDISPSGNTVGFGRTFGGWTTIYTSPNNNRILNDGATPYRFYLGTTISGTSVEYGTIYVAQNVPGPIKTRYIRTKIRDVHAWYGTVVDNISPHEGYEFQCDPNYVAGSDSFFGSKQGIMHGKTINERVLENSNDCHASIVEVGAYQEIIPREDIQPLALQRIDDKNLQITYLHFPDASETIDTPNGYRKFEPGGFLRKFTVSWSGASSAYTKFYDSDCNNCYPDDFHFGILDQNNSMIYRSDSSSGAVDVKAPASTSTLLMKGASNAVITQVDSWPSVTDAFSWGTSYSFSETAADYMTCHFRGQSFKWYATVPENKTGATVKIEIRHKLDPLFTTSWRVTAWTGWSTLVNSMTLPNNISAELVYEISYESGTLLPNTVYEIRITNLDGNFCSVDSFEGYWSGSLTNYNEDSHRLSLNEVSHFTQIYDKRFSGGSMYKLSDWGAVSFRFTGDRVILYSAKGRNHGKMRVALMRLGPTGSIYDPSEDNKVDINGAESDKTLIIDLSTGKRGNEVPQYVAFDSNEHIPGGLPWDHYALYVGHRTDDIETFSTTDTEQFENFVSRCSDCVTQTGDTVLVKKPVFIDGIAVHEALGLSVQFENSTHLEILKSVTEAIQTEADVTEEGLLVKPRLGQDTDIVLREGHNILVNYSIVNDVTQIASMLVTNGSDIDGLPLFTITEDKQTREDLGRTVMRKEDFREVADYFQLIGLSRTSLRKRKRPEKRIIITIVNPDDIPIRQADSFILYTKKMGPIRVRVNRIQIIESSSNGTTMELECVRWPQII